jgi:uncharacterized protein DUF2726
MTKKVLVFLLTLLATLSANFAEAQEAKTFINARLIGQVLVNVFIIAVVALLLSLFRRLLRGPREYPYESQRALLSTAELSFFHVLESAFGAEFRLFAKVRLADIVRPKGGLGGSARQTAFNRIQSKHVDFLACDPRTTALVFAVELDDSSHLLDGRRSRDEFVDQAFAAIGVPIVRFAARREYSVQEIRKVIGEKLNRPEPGAIDVIKSPLPKRDF